MTEKSKCPYGVDPFKLTESIGKLNGTVDVLAERLPELQTSLERTTAHVNRLNGKLSAITKYAGRRGGVGGALVAGAALFVGIIAKLVGIIDWIAGAVTPGGHP